MARDGHSRTGIAVLDRVGANYDVVLARAAAGEAAPARVTLPRLAPRRARMRLAFSVAFAVFAVSIGVAALTTGLFGAHTLRTSEAIAQVARAASVTEPPADDAFLYTRARAADVAYGTSATGEATPGAFITEIERESWLSVNRPGVIVSRRLGSAPAHPGATAGGSGEPVATTRTAYPAAGAYRIGDKTCTRAELESLPTEPHALLAVIDENLGFVLPADREQARWDTITNALAGTSPALLPDLRAALVNTLALVGGVTSLGDTATPSGATGAGFSLESQGIRNTLVFDPQTSAVMSARATVVSPQAAADAGVPAGTAIHEYELIEQHVANEPPRG